MTDEVYSEDVRLDPYGTGELMTVHAVKLDLDEEGVAGLRELARSGELQRVKFTDGTERWAMILGVTDPEPLTDGSGTYATVIFESVAQPGDDSPDGVKARGQ